MCKFWAPRWSIRPQTGFGDRYYEYLGFVRGDFENFDFWQNGGEILAQFLAILAKNDQIGS